MIGMNAETGQEISGRAHLQQSIRDILTTPIGSRVMRRDYGSRLFALTDRPLNREGLIEIYAAAAEALDLWEPRLLVTEIKAAEIAGGQVTIDIYGRYRETGEPVMLEGIVL